MAELQVSPAGPIRENQTVTLACNVPKEAPSKLQYHWYKNHALLENAHSRTLQLHAATRADTGFYFCEVQNAQGRERSGPVSVVVIRKWPACGGHCWSRARGWSPCRRLRVLGPGDLELCTPGQGFDFPGPQCPLILKILFGPAGVAH